MNSTQDYILVVDDDPGNRNLLRLRLAQCGYRVDVAADGQQALQMIEEQRFDLVLLDILMPGIDGLTVLTRIRGRYAVADLPVIMATAKDKSEDIIVALQRGANDYVTKPLDVPMALARIQTQLALKRAREDVQRLVAELEQRNQALVTHQELLQAELDEAAAYVISLLPPPLNGAVQTAWRFIPSARLGGDAFGYHWLDGEHFAMYLLDVCGHGVGAALLAVSILNVLRAQNLPGTNFHDPAAVLETLNDAFPMAQHQDRFFTMWYGVYHRGQRQLAYASGGHPPAVLVPGITSDTAPVVQLGNLGTVLGCVPGMTFPHALCDLEAGSSLYLFSDGAYEITQPDGTMLTCEAFVDLLTSPSPPDLSPLDHVVRQIQALGKSETFADDVSLLRITFG